MLVNLFDQFVVRKRVNKKGEELSESTWDISEMTLETINLKDSESHDRGTGEGDRGVGDCEDKPIMNRSKSFEMPAKYIMHLGNRLVLTDIISCRDDKT